MPRDPPSRADRFVMRGGGSAAPISSRSVQLCWGVNVRGIVVVAAGIVKAVARQAAP